MCEHVEEHGEGDYGAANDEGFVQLPFHVRPLPEGIAISLRFSLGAVRRERAEGLHMKSPAASPAAVCGFAEFAWQKIGCAAGRGHPNSVATAVGA